MRQIPFFIACISIFIFSCKKDVENNGDSSTLSTASGSLFVPGHYENLDKIILKVLDGTGTVKVARLQSSQWKYDANLQTNIATFNIDGLRTMHLYHIYAIRDMNGNMEPDLGELMTCGYALGFCTDVLPPQSHIVLMMGP